MFLLESHVNQWKHNLGNLIELHIINESIEREYTIPWQYARFDDTNISTAIINLNVIKLNVSAVQRLILNNFLMELSKWFN